VSQLRVNNFTMWKSRYKFRVETKVIDERMKVFVPEFVASRLSITFTLHR